MTGFICHDDYYDRLKRLSDEEVGRMFRMLMLYHAGRYDEMDDLGFVDAEGIAFDFIKDDIDRTEKKTEEAKETNRLNGMKGGRPRKQTEPEETEKNRPKPTVTDRNPTKAYKDKDIDKDIDIKENPLKGVKEKPSRFSPPSIEEVEAYCKERGNKINAQHFIDYYEARGWVMKSGQKVKNWKACIRTWEAGEDKPAKPTKTVVAQQYEQRDYSSVQDELMEQQDREMEEYLRKEREKGANNNAESNSTSDVLPDDSEWLFNGTG